ncbi:hypothetical protein [Actinacidiphila epipremni]|uniref:Uncharacterized protein n=1 Tax=Actinacidiphila epipremni TaxID=2053013 RepID=A0ABX1A2U7_9ACTN|nr:hypothetical protein [Actinacidiphila epipremni]NJP47918.1 hypothetical protein [Actinacidiphila epipremni]
MPGPHTAGEALPTPEAPVPRAARGPSGFPAGHAADPGDTGAAGPERLVPVEIPVIPVATTPWSGDWFGTAAAVMPVSLAVLPGGTVHTWGTVMSQVADLADGTHPAWSAAAWQARENGRPTPVAVGHPDGRVDRFLVAADGTVRAAVGPPAPAPARPAPDPCWGDLTGMPHGLCALPLGPGVASAVERAGLEAALDRDWRAATHYYTVATARWHARSHTEGTAEAERVARLATTVWLRTAPEDSAVLGFTLAHLLIASLPDLRGPIAALLRRLADHLPAAGRPGSAPPPQLGG